MHEMPRKTPAETRIDNRRLFCGVAHLGHYCSADLLEVFDAMRFFNDPDVLGETLYLAYSMFSISYAFVVMSIMGPEVVPCTFRHLFLYCC